MSLSYHNLKNIDHRVRENCERRSWIIDSVQKLITKPLELREVPDLGIQVCLELDNPLVWYTFAESPSPDQQQLFWFSRPG